ncbi:molecular chaperone DnaK [Prevotella sp. HMSC073D09]|jgi:chaperone dnaK|uniref:Hsp70 family protein n=1 Tax=Prevotella sp. HMSC073D09 TaxID=1739459 RepID=UPI0008A26789|nr:Hsp70 family protein [Prevotella sp. HMSC073D09]OFQ08376.1 molecular chaperone DnaK [Prevotella sp. HMSC073D09]
MNIITTSSFFPAIRNTDLIKGKTYVGIDFGTSTTVVSIASYDEDNNLIHTNSLRLKQKFPDGTIYSSEIVPSVIAWLNKQILVGEGASQLKYQLKSGKNIWYSFKMELGEDLGAKYYESELRDIPPFNIRNPKDAARVFFAYLKYLVTEYCHKHNLTEDISYAVSIPASFEANQRKDLLDVLMSNEMKVSKQALIDEPNAAFISYAVTRATEGQPLFVNSDYNPKILVFDFGGGTCDISILEIGQNANGFFSKNIAISKFTKLGGDDIDRYLTYHYLMPRFLKANGKKMEHFRTNEKKQIASALYKVAERLKILINKSLATLTDNFVMPDLKHSDTKTSLESDVIVFTNKGVLKQTSFYLTNKEMTEAMTYFLKKGYGKTTRIKGEDEYNSIYSPIESAIKKSKIRKEEIDYILLIGGSAQSPYIQEELKNYFEDSEILVPSNLQTHVSQGAAIHSLLFNGMNKCLIQPISSEPIFIITKDEKPKVILPAGTQFPCDTIIIDDLVTSREGQKIIELPICVGDVRKLLFNLKIESPLPSGFPVNCPIQLAVEVNTDKMFIARATCMGVVCHVEPLSPFANKELSTEERMALKAERQANLEAELNGGVPSKQTLIALRLAYSEAGHTFKAAETFELQNELYPEANMYNSIAVHYNNAGATDKAIEFYEKALEENPNHKHANANLGSTLRYSNPKRAKECLQRALSIDPDHDIALIELGRIQKSEGDITKAIEKFQKAYDKYIRQWKTNSLPSYAYGWFASLAEELGEKDFAYEIRCSTPKSGSESYYNLENLSKTKTNMLTKE